MNQTNVSKEQIFNAALELPSQDRSAYLDAVCGSDPELRKSIAQLLTARARLGRLMATGYSTLPREGERSEMPFFQARGIAPAAGFASKVEDLARFASWQFRLRNEAGEEVLRSSTLREMQRVQWVDPDWETFWGLGFVVSQGDGGTRIGHGGSCPGFRTQFSLWPEEKLAGIGMINAMGVNPGSFVEELFQLLSPVLSKARSSSEIPAVHVDLEKNAGLYRSAWGERQKGTGHFFVARVDTKMIRPCSPPSCSNS